ncbi:MAG: hypothetical protein FJX67_05265 [Alphaproteobacteria bacterium]|nr:hypothetical protein [Alphaproteobacteria bacterium]
MRMWGPLPWRTVATRIAGIMAVVAAFALPAAAQTLPPLPTTGTDTPLSSSITGVSAIADAVPSGARAYFEQSITNVTITDRLVPGIIKVPGRPPVEDPGFKREALVERSFQVSRGVFAFNQKVGIANNQLNALVLVIRDLGAEQFQQETTLDDLALAGTVRAEGNSVVSVGGRRLDTIDNSFGGSTGTVAVNQSAGAANQQQNILVIGVGIRLDPEEFVKLGSETLSGVGAVQGTVEQSGVEDLTKTRRADTITNSFIGFTGIAQVTQSAGNANVVGNRATIALPSTGFSGIVPGIGR